MKYKTIRQTNTVLSFIIMFFCICFGVSLIIYRTRGVLTYWAAAISFFLIGILFVVYTLTYDVKRNTFKKQGICIPGCVVGAERISGGKITQAYFLKIIFFDEVKKIRYTEAYFENPNDMLQDCNCNIYKKDGKYIEADFNTKRKKEVSSEEWIPINAIWCYPFSKVGRVKEI